MFTTVPLTICCDIGIYVHLKFIQIHVYHTLLWLWNLISFQYPCPSSLSTVMSEFRYMHFQYLDLSNWFLPLMKYFFFIVSHLVHNISSIDKEICENKYSPYSRIRRWKIFSIFKDIVW